VLRAPRHGKPQTHFDEQPAGSVAGGRENSDPSRPTSVSPQGSGAVPERIDTAPRDCILDD